MSNEKVVIDGNKVLKTSLVWHSHGRSDCIPPPINYYIWVIGLFFQVSISHFC